MPNITTEHNRNETTRVVTNGAVEYRFDVEYVDGVPEHTYQGDDEPPEAVVDALDEWTAEHHDVDGEDAE